MEEFKTLLEGRSDGKEILKSSDALLDGSDLADKADIELRAKAQEMLAQGGDAKTMGRQDVSGTKSAA